MKNPNWQIVLILLLAAIWASSCGGGNAGTTDGDNTDNTVTCASNAPTCSSNTDCISSCMVCDLSGEEGCCGILSCDDNLDCSDLGAGSYCSNGTCKCSAPDGDDDSGTIDGDNPEIVGELCITPSAVDFGSVQLGEGICKELEIENCGDVSVQLNGIILLQDGTALENMEIEYTDNGNIPDTDNLIKLYKGDKTTIEFCYGPTNPGIDTGEIVLGTEYGMERIPWLSTEKGFPHIAVECDGLTEEQKEVVIGRFGEEWADACSFNVVSVGETQTLPITIKNEQLDPAENAVLILSRFSFVNPDTGSTAGSTIGIDYNTIDYEESGTSIWISKEGSRKTTDFDIYYQPTVMNIKGNNNGIDRGEILVYHNDPETNGGDNSVPFVIRAIGFGIMPDLQTTPESSMNFNSVQKGQCATRVQELKNIGYDILDVYDAYLVSSSAVDNGVFTIDTNPVLDTSIYPDIPEDSIDNVKNVSLDPFQRTAITVTCCPLGNEAYTGQLEIRSNHEANPNDIRTISLNCTGQQAYCDVYPKKEIRFGAVRVDQQVSQKVVVNNNGFATAVIESIAFDATGDIDFSHNIDPRLLPLSILPGTSLEIEVYYKPESARSHSSVLTITPKEGDCNETSINLYGTGIEPDLQAPEDCLQWENTQVVDASITGEKRIEMLEVKGITIDSSGTDTLRINEIFVPDAYQDYYTITKIPSLPAQIPQGIEWGFNIAYDPPSYGVYNGYVVVCSDAANANGAPNSCSSGNCCSDATKTPHEICLSGTAINPQMCVNPSTGRLVFTNVIVGDPPPAEQQVVIENCGQAVNGNITIEDIRYAWGGSDAIQMSSIQYNGSELLDNYPQDGVELEPGEKIYINVGCNPAVNGAQKRIIEVEHNDIDMTKPGNFLGSEAPIYRIEVLCYTESNTPPKAIIQSPPSGDPNQLFGSWERTIKVNDPPITISGINSYDMDTGDAVVFYEWDADFDEDAMQVVGDLSGPNANELTVQAYKSGDYEIGLIVTDTHGSPSDQYDRDSNITIHVHEEPVAVAGRCADFSTYFETKTNENVCFTAELSKDNDGTIVAYDWEVEKVGGERFNFSTNATANYVFPEIGTYRVYLTVTDNDGYTDELSEPITVITYADDSLRIELTWSGKGDVDLHYVKPGGTFEDANSDCNGGTCTGTMDWGEYGNPKFVKDSDDGTSAEIITHDDAGDGVYNVHAKYITALEDCYTYDDCKWYDDNCAECGCNCSAICWLLDICCNSCNVCVEREECGPVPALLTFKLFYGGSSTVPDEIVSGTMWTLTDEGTDLSFQLKRENGVWSVN